MMHMRPAAAGTRTAHGALSGMRRLIKRGTHTHSRFISKSINKKWIACARHLAIMLLALAIAAQLLVGSGNMSFFGSVVTNVISLVNQLGNAGLAGLISVGVIMWLFGKK